MTLRLPLSEIRTRFSRYFFKLGSGTLCLRGGLTFFRSGCACGILTAYV